MLAISYLPTAIFGLSTNPLYRHSGLTSHTRRGLTPGIPAIDPDVGTTTQSLGHLSAEQWLHGRVPWWNPYAGVGLPLAAEMQSQSLFLPFVLLLHFSGGVTLLRIVMQLIAGMGTYALLRQMRMTNFAAFLGAVFYAFNGTFAWWGDDPMMPAAFLPLFLLGIELAVQSATEKRRGGWVWIAVALAYSLYAGFPETALINGVLALAWAVLRLAQMPRDSRAAFAAKVTVGGVTGLLLTAPLLVPFVEYVQHTAVAHSGYGQSGLPKSSFLQIFLPYIYGPIEGFIGSDTTNELMVDWGNIGGFLGVTVVFLALLAVLGEKRERALKILLLLWTSLFVARTINVSGIAAFFSLIPGVDYLAVFRYSSEAFEMAMAILAAFAIDSWRRGSVSRWQVQSALLGTSLLVAIALWLGKPLIGRLVLGAHRYPLWLWGSIGFALLLVSAIAALCVAPPTHRRIVFFGAVVAVECTVLYAIPTLSGVREVALDLRSMAYLREHLGWQRAYALGTIHPNYGSYYEVPFIDHQMIPVSGDWMTYVRKTLDSGADPVTFSGDVPAPLQARQDALRLNLKGYEATGIRYVAALHNTDPFQRQVVLRHPLEGSIPIVLRGSRQIMGTLPTTQEKLTPIDAASVWIGTGHGSAQGSLLMELCSEGACVRGSTALEGAVDNAALKVRFDHPLVINPSVPLRYKLTQTPGREAAIWMWPAGTTGASATLSDGNGASRTPGIALVMDGGDDRPKRVFQSTTADLFELSQPASYMGVSSGDCRVTIESREIARTSCRAGGKLIRRELFYPGWHVTVNGQEVRLSPSSIFQVLDVPAGDARIEFRYSPTNIQAACIAGLLGLGLLAAGCRRLLV